MNWMTVKSLPCFDRIYKLDNDYLYLANFITCLPPEIQMYHVTSLLSH